MRLRRLALLPLVLAVIASSCGGDEAGPWTSTSSAGEEAPLGAEALAAGEAIVADLGAEPALLAVAFALDRGYTAAQIAQGGRDHALRADGTITGAEPELPLWGIFSDLPEVGAAGGGGPRTIPAALALTDEEVTAEDWTRGIAADFLTHWIGPAPATQEDQAMALVGMILSLGDLGYSIEQIILWGLVAAGDEGGAIVPVVAPSGWGPVGCWFLADDDGTPLAPDGPAGEAFLETGACRQALDAAVQGGGSTTTAAGATTTTVAAADGDVDGVYVGAVTVSAAGAGLITMQESSARITVADGTAEVLVDLTAEFLWGAAFESDPCIATDRFVLRGTGAAGATTIEADLALVTFERIASQNCGEPEQEDDGETVPFTATIAGDTLSGSFFEGLLEVTAVRE